MHRRFRSGPPKIQRRFQIGLSKINRWFRIDPAQISLNILPQEIHSRVIILTITIRKEKQQNNLFEIEWVIMNFIKHKQFINLNTKLGRYYVGSYTSFPN